MIVLDYYYDTDELEFSTNEHLEEETLKIFQEGFQSISQNKKSFISSFEIIYMIEGEKMTAFTTFDQEKKVEYEGINTNNIVSSFYDLNLYFDFCSREEIEEERTLSDEEIDDITLEDFIL